MDFNAIEEKKDESMSSKRLPGGTLVSPGIRQSSNTLTSGSMAFES